MLISENCNAVIDRILTKLGKTSTPPRTALNCLNLIDFLLQNGSSKFKSEIEDERYLIKKYLSYYNEDQEELNSPVINAAQRVLELLENPEKLKEAREEARKMKERIRGFSSETGDNRHNSFSDSKYGGISSDDYNRGYDIKPEVDLNRKFGITSANTDSNKRAEDKVEVRKEVANKGGDIDLLGGDDPVQHVDNINTDLFGEKKPRKFLPPPPKKDRTAMPKFTNNDGKADNLVDDFIGLDINNKDNAQNDKAVYSKNEPKTNVNSHDLDFDILGTSNNPKPVTSTAIGNANGHKDLDMFDLTSPPTIVNVNTSKNQDVDLFGVIELNNPKPASNDNYFDLLSGKSSKLGKPPKKNEHNYDFL